MSSLRTHRVRVHPLPPWLAALDAQRLLGAGFTLESAADGWRFAEAELPSALAADVAARLRGLGFGGRRVLCEVTPPLDRRHVRNARTIDARRRRATTPGFLLRDVRLDDEGRYSLTPEALAMRIAAPTAGCHVIDAGCGVGGNAIAFARAGAQVTAIERDAQRLAHAQHNAAVYGVAARIHFVAGDALALLPELQADILFLDPPWGPAWNRVGTGLEDLPLLAAALPLANRFGALWAKLPPSFDVESVPGAVAEAIFGEATGDAQRIKLLLLKRARQG